MADDVTRSHVSTTLRLRGLAELAFGNLTHADGPVPGQHLALLRAESLELDLSDPAQRRFGDYELLECMGEGGMGVVYRARHLPLDRIVAVKLLSAGPWASREFVERFEREARNAARMQHPNIVTVYEAGSIDGMQFFSMSLVEGRSLSAVLRQGGRFAPKVAAALLRTMAEAVAYAHSLGVLHLDLKPGNVLIDADGAPHVADFGLARRVDSALAIVNDEVSGTPSYMAPEQAQVGAQGLTAATDIWGLGAILYELLTGEPPFRAESAQSTLKLVLEGQVRKPRRRQPNLPLDLQAIVLRCLARDPGGRYPTARALAEDLARFIEGRPVLARPLNAPQKIWRWARREPKLASVTFLAFGALLAGLLATFAQSRRATLNAELAEHRLWASRTDTAQREIAAGDAYHAIANAAVNLGQMEAHGDRADAALERLRIGTVLANAPQLIDVIPLSDGADVSALAISPDAKTVAVATADAERSIRLIDVASGRQIWKVATVDMSFGNMDFHDDPIEQLHFSVDGQRLVAYTLDDYPGGDQSTMRPRTVDSVMINVTAGKVVDPPAAFADFLASSHGDDGRYALLFDRHGGIQRWRTLPWTPAGDKVEFRDNINDAPHNGPLVGAARLVDHGKLMVLVSDANLKFRVYDAEHFRLLYTLMLDSGQGRATTWALRHDGRQLAIGTITGQVALWDLDSGDVDWLRSQLPGRIAALQFNPDDARLLAVSNAPSELRVFDTLSLALVAEPLKLGADSDPNVEGGVEAMFGADAHTLLTRHSAGGATVWRLPEESFPLRPPVAAVPVMDGLGTRFALATDPRSRLMASSEEGAVKLWRLRPSPLTDRVAAPMVADTLHFDGRHLVAVDGKRVRVFDVATRKTVGKVVTLPEAPTYAGLDGSGSRLIAFAGREISCWNWRDGMRCWPAVTLPDSPLRLAMAAAAPVLAVSTGSNRDGRFYEDVRLFDLATGRLRGAPIVLRGPLGGLRLSSDGHRLLAWQDSGSKDMQADELYLIDADHATILRRLRDNGTRRQQVVNDAIFMADGSIWSQSSDPWNTVDFAPGVLWRWSRDGRLVARLPGAQATGALLALPDARGVVTMRDARLVPAHGVPSALNVPGAGARDNAGAVGPDGRLLALATIDGVSLTDIRRGERLLPQLRLPLPYHEIVQQLAFAPDGSRLVGRTTSGRWFEWPLVVDRRPVAAIERDVALHEVGSGDSPSQVLSNDERRQLRAADPGPTANKVADDAAPPATDTAAALVADPRYQPLDIDAISNVGPRRPMNHATRLPPQPQHLPSLPRGLQRYDGVDFLLGRAVQLSGKPQNVLDASFPASSRPLVLDPSRRAAWIDLLVMQYLPKTGTLGTVTLRYTDGTRHTLDIGSPRDVREHWLDAASSPATLRVGWVGGFPGQMLLDGPGATAAETLSRTYIVRLANPEPGRPLASITLGAPATVSPGLLFLALTLEPAHAKPAGRVHEP